MFRFCPHVLILLQASLSQSLAAKCRLAKEAGHGKKLTRDEVTNLAEAHVLAYNGEARHSCHHVLGSSNSFDIACPGHGASMEQRWASLPEEVAGPQERRLRLCGLGGQDVGSAGVLVQVQGQRQGTQPQGWLYRFYLHGSFGPLRDDRFWTARP